MYMRLLTTITRYMRLLSVALIVHVTILENLNEMSHDVASHLGLHYWSFPLNYITSYMFYTKHFDAANIKCFTVNVIMLE